MSDLTGARFRVPSLAVALLFMILSPCFAQAEGDLGHGSVGLAASLQGGQADIMIPIWLGSSIMIAPALNAIHVGNQLTDLGFGALIRENLTRGKAVAYVGQRGGLFVLSPKGGTKTTDYLVGIAGGGEYFLSEHLSLGVEAQINVTHSDKLSPRFGNPDGTNVNTATVSVISFYF